MIKLLLTTLAFYTLIFSAFSQQNNLEGSKRYIKIILDADVSYEAQSEITNAFTQIPGVRTSRMDNTNRLYLGIYEPTDTLTEETFTNWFMNHGYTVECYYDAVYTEGGMIELSKNNCR